MIEPRRLPIFLLRTALAALAGGFRTDVFPDQRLQAESGLAIAIPAHGSYRGAWWSAGDRQILSATLDLQRGLNAAVGGAMLARAMPTLVTTCHGNAGV